MMPLPAGAGTPMFVLGRLLPMLMRLTPPVFGSEFGFLFCAKISTGERLMLRSVIINRTLMVFISFIILVSTA